MWASRVCGPGRRGGSQPASKKTTGLFLHNYEWSENEEDDVYETGYLSNQPT